MLSGMGGDEIDGGYSRHNIVFNLKYYKYIRIFNHFPWLPKKYKRDFERLFAFLSNPIPQNYYSLTAYFTKSEIENLLNDYKWSARYSEKISNLISNKPLDLFQKFIYLDFKKDF